ncbi:unnamed protein product [marine sediment metagenome]|uniref:Uncharacterized protein n=1 Tax=marine sediment metagenome TaxID=412755 RepID=X1TSF9_9ZZZZ
MEFYKIQVDSLPAIEADAYELTYSKDGKVFKIFGCVALQKNFNPGESSFQETWLSQKICQQD